MLRNALEPWHIVLLVLAFTVLFGAKRLPDGARALGRSMRILRAEARGLAEDATAPAPVTAPVAAPGDTTRPASPTPR